MSDPDEYKHCESCCPLCPERMQNQRDEAVWLLRQAEEALPDSDKLEALALWLDVDDAKKQRPTMLTDEMDDEVQHNLRRWANSARAARQAIREHLGEER